MEKTNFSQIYNQLTKKSSPKVKEIFTRRFGLKSGNQETLDSIGKSHKITRERVRQIEEAGFNFIRKNYKEALDQMLLNLKGYFEQQGGFKREDIILVDLAEKKQRPYVLFMLTIGGENFSRVCAKKDYHDFWSAVPADKVIQTLNSLVLDIEDHGKAFLTSQELLEKFAVKYNLSEQAMKSYLEISKMIQGNKEGRWGLISWPEIKPRGVRDKAILVFKAHNKPLHFRQLASLIDEMGYNQSDKKTHPQTVHNELIKDQRFVLVGRGTYALAEWGYKPGTIKEVIANILKEKQQPIHQNDIVEAVLAQRLVAKGTVLVNLNNKKYFQRDNQGRYSLKEVQAV